MATVQTSPETIAELLEQLGDVPPHRVRMHPLPGQATPADVLRLLHGKRRRICELVDGVLVEKAMGHQESRLAFWLVRYLANYLDSHDVGIATVADGPHQLDDDLVRFPDVAFIPYENIPEGADPGTSMPDSIPALAVEILSPGNTRSEMDRKLADYFAAGVRLVWSVDPAARSVRVYRGIEDELTLGEGDMLDGGDVLPGFRVPIGEWFDRATRVSRRS